MISEEAEISCECNCGAKSFSPITPASTPLASKRNRKPAIKEAHTMNKIVPYTPNRPRSSPYYQTAQPPPPNELRIVRSRDQQGYELFEIDIGDYDQRDVSVQVHSDNHLAIHAVHYFNYLDKFNYVRKELLRTFELPANANHEYISSSLSHDGILSIHVPLRLPVPPYDPQPMDTMAVPFRSTGHSNNRPTSSNVVDIVAQSPRRTSMFSRFMPTTNQLKHPEQRFRALSGSRVIAKHHGISVHEFMDSPLKPEYSKRTHAFIVRLNLKGFKPHDVSIKVEDFLLTVNASQSYADGFTRKNMHNFHKQFRLPEEADVRRIKSELNPRGILVIEIPLIKY